MAHELQQLPRQVATQKLTSATVAQTTLTQIHRTVHWHFEKIKKTMLKSLFKVNALLSAHAIAESVKAKELISKGVYIVLRKQAWLHRDCGVFMDHF